MNEINKSINILVLGASTNQYRYSNMAVISLRNHGYNVISVGNREGSIADVAIQKTLPVGIKVDTVTLYLNPKILLQYVESIIDLKPRRVIFNPGTEDQAILQQIASHNIECIEACTLVMINTNQF